ncbi:MAG: Rpn family recombination-promoting nuclease/putative transposase [Treponema sp.]|nr:Rpn family recombination-promoting nuclease/putative transposase [Treponema sp.]
MPQENQTSLKDETELFLAEKWKNATIANNFIFYKVMHNNPDVCKELLEILLQIKIDHIVMQTEETIEVDYDKKGVRLDVYAEGVTKAYNLEMQATDKGELPERARYYQGILDVQALDHGDDYKDLKDSYVIFICVPDIFGKGLAKYTFENLCLENPEIQLNDRAYKYFFIAKNYDKILDEKQKAFLKLVMSSKEKGTNSFTEKVSRLVEEAKQNSQWRKQFMEWEREMAYKFREGKQEGKAEGLLEGAQQNAIENAKNFLAMKVLTPEQISQGTKLPLEKVLELQKEMLVHA